MGTLFWACVRTQHGTDSVKLGDFCRTEVNDNGVHLFIVLCMGKSRGHASFTGQLDDLILDFCQSCDPIDNIVSEAFKLYIGGVTHVANWTIASIAEIGSRFGVITSCP